MGLAGRSSRVRNAAATVMTSESGGGSPELRREARLLVFEGVDGVGKSTVAREVGRRLRAAGVPTINMAFPGNQPGSLGELVYRIHHGDESVAGLHPSPIALQALHISAHMDAIERAIGPALAGDQWVVLDRFWWSTLIYGRAAGCNERALQMLVEAEKVIWGPIVPPHIVLLEREAPLRRDAELPEWKRLGLAYSELAGTEKVGTVHRICDAPTVECACDTVFAEIESLSHLGKR